MSESTHPRPLGRVLKALGPLYDSPVASSRKGPLYNAFSYPTKIDPEAIALYIATHTAPGETVLDAFAGSGTTGIAARLCDAPTQRMLDEADRLGLSPQWGPRHAILFELTRVGALAGKVMSNPPDPEEFITGATAILETAEREAGWLYEAVSPVGRKGRIRHTIWSDKLTCPSCGAPSSFWSAGVEWEPLRVQRELGCDRCDHRAPSGAWPRVLTTRHDDVLGRPVSSRERLPVKVYGVDESGRWFREPTQRDLDLLLQIDATPLPRSVPVHAINWGDLYRSGYHEGVTHLHHFYTRRNLLAFATVWDRIDTAPPDLREALQLLALSYNATHSTLMTRVVVKSGEGDFVVTGSQSGVLYVSSLPVEKNVFIGIRRKISTFANAFRLTRDSGSSVDVFNDSSTSMGLAEASVDYVFTDPPFGAFIPYSEVHEINEAWLGEVTDRSEEAIISPAQSKGVTEYEGILRSVFHEVRRVLKDDGVVTLVFHSSDPAVWRAITDTLDSAGFEVAATNVLDKTQVSFKQVVSAGSTRGDAVALLVPAENQGRSRDVSNPAEILSELRAAAEVNGDRVELSPERLYSRYVGYCLEKGLVVTASAPAFYALILSDGG